MWVGNVSAELWEIESAQARAKRRHVVLKRGRKGVIDVHDLATNELLTAVAIARAGVTSSPSWTDGYWRALSAYAQLQANCVTVGTTLRVQPGVLQVLRDSSRTSWSGMLGQGICWLTAMLVFECDDIVDFETACVTKLGIAPPGLAVKRPDFLCSDDAWSSFMVFESKGTTSAKKRIDWKAELRGGLAQVDAGVAWLKAGGYGGHVQRGVAVAFALREGGPSLGAFADPEGEDVPPRPMGSDTRLALARLHYAYWAAAGGLWWLADLLRDGGTDRIRADMADVGTAADSGEVVLREGGFPIATEAGTRPCVHAIDARVLDAVLRGDLPALLAARRAVRGHSSSSRVVLPDGTTYTSR